MVRCGLVIVISQGGLFLKHAPLLFAHGLCAASGTPTSTRWRPHVAANLIGSPAGVAAATAAARLGLRVALYEPLPMIGGMGAAGNLALNDGGQEAEREDGARARVHVAQRPRVRARHASLAPRVVRRTKPPRASLISPPLARRVRSVTYTLTMVKHQFTRTSVL